MLYEILFFSFPTVINTWCISCEHLPSVVYAVAILSVSLCISHTCDHQTGSPIIQFFGAKNYGEIPTSIKYV